MKRLFLAALLACAGSASALADDALKAALGGAQRSAANTARDTARHPYETLRFFGIRPDMTVVELAPGGGWYTEILAPYLRERGQLIAAGDDPQSSDADARRGAARFQQKLAASPAVFDKVKSGVFEPPHTYRFAAKGSADMVLTFRNIHNWIPAGPDKLATLFASVYDSLKPGGVFGVVEHRLPAARAQDAEASSGYLHEAYVIGLAEAAGFKLAARSEINANPRDTADHQNGVWALPPTYANKDVERARYTAIGESDRMTLKFVKP
ncbi:class I SAM-dependent methyltransferase [Janthinobacterium fluminis]|uniref:Methyltransferase n=1 Tax=Janthinobacterium fluminis TaxID=2987524 RepID=A0ABT5K737_9BURK|nr:methyltransferase [Janthinobacterium fluminis]MDC8760817.1 methyltransferase [Janthinobacterium fluminis]